MANFGQRPFMFDIDGYMKVRSLYSPLSRQPRCLRSPYLALRFISLGKAVSAGVGGRCRFPRQEICTWETCKRRSCRLLRMQTATGP